MSKQYSNKLNMSISAARCQQKASSNIEKICRELINQLKNTDNKVLDSFKPYIKPKTNIEMLIDFYELFISSFDQINEIQEKIEETLFPSDRCDELKIKDLNSQNTLETVQSLEVVLKKLEVYKKVKIAFELHQQGLNLYEKCILVIRKVFFRALKRLPKIINTIEVYAAFLMNACDKKDFLFKYSEQVVEYLGFSDISTLSSLVSRTTNLASIFKLIVKINIRILGSVEAVNINVGMLQLMVINLKKVFGGILMKVEKSPKPERIPYLVRLHKNLSHGISVEIKQIESLFIFRDEILKLTLNCFIQYFAVLEGTDMPRTDYKTEEVVNILPAIFNAFEENIVLKNEWVKKFGPSFGVYDPKHLYSNFSRKCLEKIINMASEAKLENYEYHVYCINQKTELRKYLETFENISLESSIKKNVDMILGLWKINIDKYSGVQLNNFILRQLKDHKRLHLPEREREDVHNGLSRTIEFLIASQSLEGQTGKLKLAIEESYFSP